MSKPLVPPHVMAQVRLVAEQGMQTDLTIRRRSVSTPVSDDYGDDVVTYADVVTTVGWFHSTPTPVQVEDAGSLVTINTYRLFLPVGTDVLDGDEVVVGESVYIVSDTTAESTWQAMLKCSLRKRD